MTGTTLRGIVAQKYGSCTKFAEALGWSGRKARDIVSGRQIANAKDINEMAKVLAIYDASEFLRIFFDNEVHKVDS